MNPSQWLHITELKKKVGAIEQKFKVCGGVIIEYHEKYDFKHQESNWGAM